MLWFRVDVCCYTSHALPARFPWPNLFQVRAERRNCQTAGGLEMVGARVVRSLDAKLRSQLPQQETNRKQIKVVTFARPPYVDESIHPANAEANKPPSNSPTNHQPTLRSQQTREPTGHWPHFGFSSGPAGAVRSAAEPLPHGALGGGGDLGAHLRPGGRAGGGGAHPAPRWGPGVAEGLPRVAREGSAVLVEPSVDMNSQARSCSTPQRCS